MKSLKLRLIIVISLFIGVAQMLLVNNFAAASFKISQLERERMTLAASIDGLQNSIFEETALPKISTKAKTLGLNYSIANFDFLSVPRIAVKSNVTP